MKNKRNILIVSACTLLGVGALGFAFYVSVLDSVPKFSPKSLEMMELNVPLSNAQTINQTLDGFTVTRDSTSVVTAETTGTDSPATAESTVYKCSYEMNVRKSPDYDAEKVGKYKENETVTITETQNGERGSVWGKISDDHWICLKDDKLVYCTKQ